MRMQIDGNRKAQSLSNSRRVDRTVPGKNDLHHFVMLDVNQVATTFSPTPGWKLGTTVFPT